MHEVTFEMQNENGMYRTNAHSYMTQNERCIFIVGMIEDEMATEVISEAYALSKQSDEPITFYINSIGGSISAGMAIMDYVHSLNNEIITIGMGTCCSMGAFLLSTLSKDRRYVMLHTTLLYHQPLIGSTGGQASDLEIVAYHMKEMKETINRLLSDYSKIPYEDTFKLFDRDCWLTPVQALEYGLIDGVVQ